ncbi:MAG: transposase [Lachnospiraceae bacterium]|jgi:hypothetical protein|nr:transposase [Lachnospiraceae bacterium]MCH4033824.1 transposase [Lachnospiraceae bacterium]MCH4034953.1 transposase [Lachnospiraceae bacterium]MCH4034965.1 transposase [Lachnospiraceae bacterium]MCH4035467.1 transposase [Lachnospiraceae bacterium]
MYLTTPVGIPDVKGITYLSKNGTEYVRYAEERKYDKDKKYTLSKHKIIGKRVKDQLDKMYPNENFMIYFPDLAYPPEEVDPTRSVTINFGAFLIIQKVMEKLKMKKKLLQHFEAKDAGKIMDLMAYSIVTEDNKALYYPIYTFNHPLFTDSMHRYSDSSISNLLGSITDEQIQGFLNDWNADRDHNQKVNISYDSTNKHCQSGDIETAEPGHSKDGVKGKIFNYAIGYDLDNRMPLFYEWYPGSIPDVSQLAYIVGKAKGYGYSKATFIIDRGYFSEDNLRYLDKNGLSFIIMCKGQKDLISKMILEHRGLFEEKRDCKINNSGVYGMTEKADLADRERYFHLYHSTFKEHVERKTLEDKISEIGEKLKKLTGKKVTIPKDYENYFDIIMDPKDPEVFVTAVEKTDVIEAELKTCGYFAIITSEEMDAVTAYRIYKSRDASEKLFGSDKSFLGDATIRVASTGSASSKIFIEFLALTVRSEIYSLLKDQKDKNGDDPNFMTVPGALAELEMIQMTKLTDGRYHMDYAVTKNQKMILSAFGMNSGTVKREAEKLADQFEKYDQTAAESSEE